MHYHIKISAFLITFIAISINVKSQEDLDSLLNSEMEQSESINYENSTFFYTRVINGQSVKLMTEKGLDFRIVHHTGLINGGVKELYGLDEASSYIGFEYGITNWLMAGVGHASFEKAYNGFIKAALFRQSTGKLTMPVSVVYFGSITTNGTDYMDEERNGDFKSRLDYTNQLIIGSKITPRLSLQVSPTIIHRNLVKTVNDKNNIMAIGLSGRYRPFKVVSFNVEYFYVEDNPDIKTEYYDPISIGMDYQVSKHVFQLYVTNSLPITDNSLISETNGDFWSGDIRFGFSISTVFTVGKKKE